MNLVRVGDNIHTADRARGGLEPEAMKREIDREVYDVVGARRGVVRKRQVLHDVEHDAAVRQQGAAGVVTGGPYLHYSTH